MKPPLAGRRDICTVVCFGSRACSGRKKSCSDFHVCVCIASSIHESTPITVWVWVSSDSSIFSLV
jgi:hypothetical protein